jgi:hypothetical protein
MRRRWREIVDLEGKSGERIPVLEQDLDLGREGVSGFGLKRNGLGRPIEEVVHHR